MLFKELTKSINNIIENKQQYTFDQIKQIAHDLVCNYAPKSITERYKHIISSTNDKDNIIEILHQVSVDIETFLNTNDNKCLEIIHNNIQHCDYSSRHMISNDISYEDRMSLFEKYINEYVFYDGKNSENILEDIEKLLNILYLPFHERYSKYSKFGFSIRLECNHSGKCANNLSDQNEKKKYQSKSCGCCFYLTIYIPIDPEKKKISKFKKDPSCISRYESRNVTFSYFHHSLNEIHNHPLNFDFVIEKNSFLTQFEREKLREEFSLVSNIEDVSSFLDLPGVKAGVVRELFNQSKQRKKKELEFLDNYTINDNDFVKLSNDFSDGTKNSFIFMNKRILNDSSSKNTWWIDDTLNLLEYNMPVLGIVVKDVYGNSQILSISILHDKSEKSFDVVFDVIKKCCQFNPNVICMDRCQAQFNSVRKHFEESKIIFCHIHLKRNLENKYGKSSPIVKLFKKTMQNQIHESIFLNCVEQLLSKCNDEDFEDPEDPEKDEDLNFHQFDFLDEDTEFDEFQDESVEHSKEDEEECDKETQELVNQVLQMNIKGKAGCLKGIYNVREHWLPSICILLGMYKNNTTNIIESLWGEIKKRKNNKKMTISELYNLIRFISSTKLKKNYFVGNIKELSNFNQREIKPYFKLVLLEQLQLFRSGEYDHSGNKCMSCKVRKVNKDNAFICCHYIEQYFGNNNEILFTDLPKFCFKKQLDNYQSDEKMKEYQIKNIELQTGTIERSGIRYIPQQHNSNYRQRNNVDKRVRKNRRLSHFNQFKIEYLKTSRTDNYETESQMELENEFQDQDMNDLNDFQDDLNDFNEMSLEHEKSSTNNNIVELTESDLLNHYIPIQYPDQVHNNTENPDLLSLRTQFGTMNCQINSITSSLNPTLPKETYITMRSQKSNHETETTDNFEMEEENMKIVLFCNDIQNYLFKLKDEYTVAKLDLFDLLNDSVSKDVEFKIRAIKNEIDFDENTTKFIFPLWNKTRWQIVIFCSTYLLRDGRKKNVIINIGTKNLQNNIKKSLETFFTEVVCKKVKTVHNVKSRIHVNCFKKDNFYETLYKILTNDFDSDAEILNLLSN